MKRNKFLLLILSLTAFGLGSCQFESQADKEEDRMLEYIESHQINAIKHESGLYYRIDSLGTGAQPVNSISLITVDYSGKTLDDAVFDDSDPGDPLQINLNNLIQAWRIAIPLIRKDGKIWFILPSRLGYGDKKQGSIPANSVLIFEVRLLDYVN